MTKLIQETFEQILQLSEEQQDTLATYLHKPLIKLLEKSEKEKRIAKHNDTLNENINPLPKRRIPPVSIAGTALCVFKKYNNNSGQNNCGDEQTRLNI